MQYYVVVEEWLYPTESGRNIIGAFDVSSQASDQAESVLLKARELAEAEEENFEINCKVDCLPATQYCNVNGYNANMSKDEIGYIITSKIGLDNWYYAVRIIPISSIDSPFSPVTSCRELN